MAVTKIVAVPSVDFKCAMTIHAKSRSIIAVMLNNSFIPLATRRTEKMTAASDYIGNSDGEHGSSDGGDDSGKRQASSNDYSSLRASAGV